MAANLAMYRVRSARRDQNSAAMPVCLAMAAWVSSTARKVAKPIVVAKLSVAATSGVAVRMAPVAAIAIATSAAKGSLVKTALVASAWTAATIVAVLASVALLQVSARTVLAIQPRTTITRVRRQARSLIRTTRFAVRATFCKQTRHASDQTNPLWPSHKWFSCKEARTCQPSHAGKEACPAVGFSRGASSCDQRSERSDSWRVYCSSL